MSPSEHRGKRVGTSTRRLSLAVRPVDAFTNGTPTRRLDVHLVDRPVRAVRGTSGAYLFFDLDEDMEAVQTIVVEPTARYLRSTAAVTLAELDPLNPVVDLPLVPSPAYSFPSWTTLVRGHVRDSNDDPVADAAVTLSNGAGSSRTDGRGEFVVAVPDVGATDVIEQDGSRTVAPDGDPLTLSVTHPTAGTASERITVEEGGMAVVDLSLEQT